MLLKKISFILSILFCFFVSLSFAGTITYQYDSLNRLVKTAYPDGKVIEYTYDAAGNRLSKVSTTNPGDANGDGSINVRDVICIINVILDTGTASGSLDCNGDGDVNVLDVICVINKILGG